MKGQAASRRPQRRPPGRQNPGEARLRSFFEAKGWQPFPFQEAAWAAYRAGRSALVHAATGVGKTLALWGGPLIDWAERDGGAAAEAPPLRLIWLTPLRALATDTREALEAPLGHFETPWTVGLRTGDTPTSERRRQGKRLPTVLITTPESLAILLSHGTTRDRLIHLEAVFVDEWHELLGTKRGVMTELLLARLRRWRPKLRIWGLSATLANPQEALSALIGPACSKGRLITGPGEKAIEIVSVLPETPDRFPWAGHLGLRLLESVIEAIEGSRTTLVFTNTRSQTEQWYQAVTEARPDWKGQIGLHHGSISSAARLEVEDGLRNGRLRAVICTSSLDLGVDFSPVDQVIQIGSPKGIARLMQRAGRSGHQPGRTSCIRFIPSHAFELAEIAAVRHAIGKGRLESRKPLEDRLDVLAQHMVTLALGGGFDADSLFSEIRDTLAYRCLSRRDFDWVLGFVTSGGRALSAYPDYRRVEQVDGRYRMTDRRLAARHRMNIGTITDDPSVWVKYTNGHRQGTIEENFAARLRPGDDFIFAGKILRVVRFREATLYVKKSKAPRGSVPRWMGGRMPLSTDLAEEMRWIFDRTARGDRDGPEMAALEPIFELQARWSAIPAARDLLIESVTTREGHHVFIFPFEGRSVHEGLAALLAYRLSRLRPMTLSYAVNDYGLELLSDREIPVTVIEGKELFSVSGLKKDLLSAINAAELIKRRFREIAHVSGLVVGRHPGREKSAAQLQSSAGLLFSVLNRYDPDNRFLGQAQEEVLEGQLEWRRLEGCLRRLMTARRRITQPPQISPLAFPVMVDRLRSSVSSEKLADRLERILKQANRAADAKPTSREPQRGESAP